MNEELFQENIHRWSRVNPKKAMRLQFLQGSSLTSGVAKNGSPNLIREKDGRVFYFHDESDPEKEAKNWFQSLNLVNATVIYVYGVGLGYYYDAAKEWLEEDPLRSLIFLEDDAEVVHAFFHTERASAFLKDTQTYLFYFTDLKDEEGIFEELYWDFILTQMEITALKSYESARGESYLELKHKIVHDAAIKNALVEEYLHCGIPFFRNFYPNMLWLSESWKGTQLYNKFENIPAVICGAGPSLEKNILELKEVLDRAIVFGGGSALNALSSRGILPHFGIGVDPNPTQQYRLSSNKAYEVPLFYRNRMHVDAFRLVHGPRLYIPGAGGYEVADWFDEQFGLLEDIEWLDEGHNVVNFGLELAYNLGCNPIIFVGVDLAYTEMQSYASGIIDDTTVKEKDILETDDFDTTALLKKDIYGNPIYTLWKWVAESEWTSDYAAAHPELTIINCTEGGLGMPDVPNMPFKEAAEKYLNRSYDLRSLVQGEILSSEMRAIDDRKVIDTMVGLRDSLKRSKEHINDLLEDKKRYQMLLDKDKEVPEVKQSGLAALAETELEEEPAYEYILGVFNLVYSRILNRELQQVQNDEREIPVWKKEKKITEINSKRLEFMSDVASVNLEIIENSLKEREEQIKV